MATQPSSTVSLSLLMAPSVPLEARSDSNLLECSLLLAGCIWLGLVCTCVQAFVHVLCAFTHTHTHIVHTHACTHARTRMHTHAHTCTHTHTQMHARTHTHTHTHTCMYTHTHTHTHVHAHAHIHIHPTYTHMNTQHLAMLKRRWLFKTSNSITTSTAGRIKMNECALRSSALSFASSALSWCLVHVHNQRALRMCLKQVIFKALGVPPSPGKPNEGSVSGTGVSFAASRISPSFRVPQGSG